MILLGLITYFILFFSDPGFINIENKTIEKELNFPQVLYIKFIGKKLSNSSFIDSRMEFKNRDEIVMSNNFINDTKKKMMNSNELNKMPKFIKKISSARSFSPNNIKLYVENDDFKQISNSERNDKPSFIPLVKSNQKNLLKNYKNYEKISGEDPSIKRSEEIINKDQTFNLILEKKNLAKQNTNIHIPNKITRDLIENDSFYSKRSGLSVKRNKSLKTIRKIHHLKRSKSDEINIDKLKKIRENFIECKFNRKNKIKNQDVKNNNSSNFAQDNTITILNQNNEFFKILKSKEKIDMLNLEVKDSNINRNNESKFKAIISSSNNIENLKTKNERSKIFIFFSREC